MLAAACMEATPPAEVDTLQREGLLSWDRANRWRIGADGRYTIPFYANPANGLVVPGPGATCPATGNCDHGVALRQALDVYERLTPIRFTQLGAPLPQSSTGNYLHYIDCNAGTSHMYRATTIPADIQEELEVCDPSIMSTLLSRPGSDGVGLLPNDMLIVLRQDVDFANPGPPLAYHIPLHETGHALGLQHENKRSDLESAGIDFYADCVGGDMDAFTELSDDDYRMLSPYDVDSMMQYPSTTKCARDGAACGVAGDAGCTCFPLLLAVAADASGPGVVECTSPEGDVQRGRIIAPPGGISDEDINVIHQMYPPRLGVNALGDRFGAAVVSGDFDGDGYDDLAVGAPGEKAGGPAAGAVFVFKGTMNGLQPWRRLLAPTREDGDEFGAALAVGRLDGDGQDDLLVGAPRIRAREGEPRAGGVFVYYGRRRGPGDRHFLHQENLGFDGARNRAGDRFGAAIVAGDFDGAGRPEIAIGAPGDLDGGRVYVLDRLPGGGYGRFARVGDERDAGDGFGAALLAADLGGDDADELIVGSPETGNGGAGHVYVFRKDASGFRPPTRLAEPNGPVSGDRFGAALAAGIFSRGGARRLVVGAPGRASGRGNVWVLRLDFAGGGVTVDSFTRIALLDAGLAGQAGAELGSALAAADLDDDGRDDLAIGAPGYDGHGLAGNGAVSILRGMAGELTSPTVRFEPAGHGVPEIYDEYGTALAVGQFNGGSNLDLAVGTPGHDPDARGDDFAGSVWPLRGQPDAMPEETPSAEFFSEYLDQEYGVSR
jgi:hypothetical protein